MKQFLKIIVLHSFSLMLSLLGWCYKTTLFVVSNIIILYFCFTIKEGTERIVLTTQISVCMTCSQLTDQTQSYGHLNRTEHQDQTSLWIEKRFCGFFNFLTANAVESCHSENCRGRSAACLRSAGFLIRIGWQLMQYFLRGCFFSTVLLQGKGTSFLH